MSLFVILWFFSGLISFFANIGNTINFVKTFFNDAVGFVKVVWWIIMFTGHVTTGMVSLIGTIYHFLTSL